MAGPTKSGGRSGLKQRVKTARKRKASSTRWLERHINDPYVARTKAEGWRSRAAFKLIEIDDRHKLIRPGMRIADLGCAPGGWLQVAAQRTGSNDADPLVAGIDYLPVDPVPGCVILQKDFLDDDAEEVLHAALGNHPLDIVLSDMAAPTTGHRQTDHLRTMHLCEIAAEFAIRSLRPGGDFLAKTFRGGTEGELLTMLKQRFATVAHVKPPASRAESVELFLLARGFRG